MKLTASAQFVLDKLNQSNYKAYIVGGTVRDFLLNKHNTDIDVTTNALPDQVKDVFKGYKIFDTGIKHGTVSLLINGELIEITTFRKDEKYLDNRHPSSITFVSSLREDLLRRDFTINAMAYNIRIYDYYGGREDLKNKILRAVGDANERFREDALRILRALRFSSVLGFTIEEKTKQAMFDNKSLLKNISHERIREEFDKILLGQNAEEVLLNYEKIFEEIIPEFALMYGFEQHNEHHIYDVYFHCVKAVASSKKDLIIRLALMFHDIGKPNVFSLDEQGRGHFYNHAVESKKIARDILNRLKYDNNTKKQVLTLIEHHDVVLNVEEKCVKRWLNRLGEDLFDKLIEVERGDNFAQHPKHRDRQIKLDQIVTIKNKIIENKNCFSLKQLAINGRDLIALGMKGRAVGQALNKILNLVLNGELENDKAKIIEYIKSNKKCYH